MSGAVRGTVAIRGTTKLLLVGATVLLLHTDQNPHGLSASCSECVPCAKRFTVYHAVSLGEWFLNAVCSFETL